MKPKVLFAVAIPIGIIGYVCAVPSLAWSAAGVGGADATITRCEPENAKLRTIISDTRGKKQWKDYWVVGGETPKSKIHLSATVGKTKTLLGIRIPVQKRGFRVQVPFDRDIAGAENGFIYEATWITKNSSP
jgi:hypothetical protein